MHVHPGERAENLDGMAHGTARPVNSSS